jgi:hypothetical protein
MAFFLGVLAGCGGTPYQMAKISGTITYKGKPIPQGRIAFITTDGNGYNDQGQITEGHYIVVRAPVGLCKVQISVIQPAGSFDMDPNFAKGAKGQIKMMQAKGMAPPDAGVNTKGDKRKRFEFNNKYSDVSTSGLTFEVQKGEQTKDWALD